MQFERYLQWKQISYKKINLDISNLRLSRKYGIDVADISLVVLEDEDKVNGPFHYGMVLKYKAVGKTDFHKIYFPVKHPIMIRDRFDALFLIRLAKNAINEGLSGE